MERNRRGEDTGSDGCRRREAREEEKEKDGEGRVWREAARVPSTGSSHAAKTRSSLRTVCRTQDLKPFTLPRGSELNQGHQQRHRYLRAR